MDPTRQNAVVDAVSELPQPRDNKHTQVTASNPEVEENASSAPTKVPQRRTEVRRTRNQRTTNGLNLGSPKVIITACLITAVACLGVVTFTAKKKPTEQPPSTAAQQAEPPSVHQASGVPQLGNGVFEPARGVFPDGKPLTGMTYTVKFMVEGDSGVAGSRFGNSAFQLLNDERGWREAADISFTPLPDKELRNGIESDLTFVAASPKMAAWLCQKAVGATPVCFTGTKIVISTEHWLKGSKTYGTDVASYQRYLINHGAGLAFGQDIVGCKGQGARASIMMQQSTALHGCKPNPWPIPK